MEQRIAPSTECGFFLFSSTNLETFRRPELENEMRETRQLMSPLQSKQSALLNSIRCFYGLHEMAAQTFRGRSFFRRA
jgi:hypothetical protein